MSGLSPGPWRLLSTVVLVCWTGYLAAAQEEISAFYVDKQSNTSVTLKWEPPNNNYTVTWAKDGQVIGTNDTSDIQYTVNHLQPGTAYEFTVRVQGNSSGRSLNASTLPNEVQDLRMDARSNSSVTLKWLAPDGPQPADYTYWISWGREDGLAGQNHTTEMGHIVGSLAPATVYNFTVTAEKNGVHSSGQSIQEATDYTYWISWGREGVPRGADNTSAEQYTAEALEPGSPYEFRIRSMSNEVNSSAQMLRVFTEPNEVRNLQVVRQTNNSIEFSWMAPEGPTEPTYQVSWFLSEIYQRQVFTNGTNFTADGLTPGTWYQFLVRSVTEDEAQSPERTVNASTAPDPVTITSCTSDAAGYGVILTFACPAGNQESFEYELGGHQGTWPRPCPSSMPVGGLQPDKSYTAIVWSLWAGMKAPQALVGRAGGSGTPCRIGALTVSSLVLSLSNQHLALEGTGQPQTASLAPENRSKNRFSNVLPYDWSRVPLQPIPGDPSSDYINASFVPGLVGPQEYIATQGPLPQTVSDFWRLVWDQQSRTVVMLTNCVEGGRVKCEHYWPLDAKPCSHGHLRVTLKWENVAEHWTVRDLHLFHMELNEGLFVRQFHYTVWPDHGVPGSPDPLLAFRALLRNWLDQSLGGGPPIVHCSAGVGRTGTLIALDVLLRQLQKYQQVGVQSFIRKMRRSRPLMVQTEGQYIFLYQTLLRSLQLSQDGGEDCRDQEGVLYENMEAIQAYEQEIGFREEPMLPGVQDP
ncbi:receptor-type tyrosine-protein phosphatase H [Vombatus ursinus]|uniref:receptor-type tyrosine-protein phosphatase H n=1 Tax=Vombatus ursinus TaxID=29139 RepID=UPI000FFD2AAC|nr:receptor-type tyrosine-protein phosphatase H [Vombatus ursinus]